MFKRNIIKTLEKAIKRSRVVLLNGARQVGKTTLAMHLMKNKNYNYITFDDEITYISAKENPEGFIANIEKPVIIDEVQRVPELFLVIKKDVDKNNAPGRYLLTGSANPLLIPKLGDSLAGRMEVIDLMPLSQGEIAGKQENFIDNVFAKNISQKNANPISKKDLYIKILDGGYPGIVHLDQEDKDAWMRNYLNLILQRDIKDLAQIEKIEVLPKLLKVIALRCSSLLNQAEIARELKMNAKTLERYVVLLKTIFLINLQPTWSSNRTLRFIKSPKVYMVDSGLLSYLLDANMHRAMTDSTMMGKVVENFIVGELKKQATWSKKDVQLYHFRTTAGKEVDVVLEDRSGNIVGIEIKSNEKVCASDFNGLRFLEKKSNGKLILGIVMHTGKQCIPFDKNLYAVPISALWS